MLKGLHNLKPTAVLRGAGGVSGPSISGLTVTGDVLTATISAAGTAYYIYSASPTSGSASSVKTTALGLTQTLTIAAGPNTGSLINFPTANGTYYLHMVLQTAGGAFSNVAVSNAIVISAYAYTWVYNSASPHTTPTASFKITPASFTANRLTFATAVNFQGWANGNILVRNAVNSSIWIDNATKKLRVVWKDYFGVTSFDYTSSETFALSTDYDLYVAVDFTGGGSISAYRNGTALTLTGSTTLTATLEFKSNDEYWFGSDNAVGFSANLKQAYVWCDFRSTANLGPTSFYSGGPKDLSGLAQPTIWRGHTMTADAEGADTTHGWNDNYNKGYATGLVVNSATYSDT